MAVHPINRAEQPFDRVGPSAYSLKHAIQQTASTRKRAVFTRPPQPSAVRLEASNKDRPFSIPKLLTDVQCNAKEGTIFYLAYGSNLQAAKFRGDRGIKPLAQINVQVPSLRMTFDLPGIPYSEPCFANTARRDPNNDARSCNEKTALLSERGKEKYKKNAWHKSLIGVVYEVTPQDYAHIIATEGGGAGYQDIVVECHPFVNSDPTEPVPETPSLPPFKAHTLFAPWLPEGDEPPKQGGHVRRPDPDYAQASERYLNIVKEGAAECELPFEYQEYLHSIRPYNITTVKQRMGQFVFLATWMPIVLFMFGLGKIFTDEKGRLPDWMVQFMNAVFTAVWASYDSFFRPMFGDGERTIDKDDSDDEEGRRRSTWKLPLYECDAEKETS